jgi:hypothetical protein
MTDKYVLLNVCRMGLKQKFHAIATGRLINIMDLEMASNTPLYMEFV